MLSQRHLVVKSWRARIYNFSSGTLLKMASQQLRGWIHEENADEPGRKACRVKYLEKLVNKDGLFTILGDAVLRFIQLKPQPFPNALFSKRHFNGYAVWKRAMVALHMVRVVLDFPASKQWHDYNAGDYKWNVRFFRFWCKKDTAIINASKTFKALPDDLASPSRGRKRKRPVASPSVSSTSEAPLTVFVVNDTSSDEDPVGSEWA